MSDDSTERRTLENVFKSPLLFYIRRIAFKALVRIPPYQRAYSWHRKQRSDMFNDIKNLEGTPDSFHFMATVVGLRRESRLIGADRYNVIEVVDGQQRLTTLVLLLKLLNRN